MSHGPIVSYEDSSAYVNQLNVGFIKMDRTKHVDSQIFSYTHDLLEDGQLVVKKIESSHNIADMLTKALSAYTHKSLKVSIRSRGAVTPRTFEIIRATLFFLDSGFFLILVFALN